MALFGRKKNTEPAVEEKKEATPVVASASGATFSHVLQNPRITEKATMHSAESVYTFDVSESATKRDIMAAVRRMYSVTPRMVRVLSIPRKEVRNVRTGKRGVKGGGKKAYVYLKKGETITIS
jgi:large subunit ribosomal protein L23